MPNVTLPPIVLDPVNGATDDSAGSHFIGPFLIGSNLYALMIGEELTHKLKMFKSTDSGSTWTFVDSGIATSQTFDCLLNGTVFTICYTSTTAHFPLKIVTYDTATDTFGAPSVDGPLTGGNARIAQFANGDLLIAYNQFGGGGAINVLIYVGGVFGVATLIPNGKNSIGAVLMGANNIAQIIYYDETFIAGVATLDVFLRTFTDAQVLGAEQVAFSSHSDPFQQLTGVPFGRPVFWNGGFVIPYYIGNDGGTNGYQAGVWIGAPYTAPVWTFTLVDHTIQPGPFAGDFGAFALVDGTNNLILFWSTLNYFTTVNMSFAINSGAGFGAPQVYYDELANPPLNPPLQFGPIDILPTSVTRYADGTFGVLGGFCGCPNAQCIGNAYLVDGGAKPPVPPLLPSPPTYWNPGSAVSLLCEKNYPWSIPPKDRIPVSVRNSIPAPAANVLTELWSYQVPDGFWFVYDTLLFFAQVAGFVEGSGSLIFTLDVNTPTVGAALPVGRPLAKFTTNVGELAEPVKTAPVQLYQGDILRAKVNITDNTLGVGLPNVIHAAVEGWLFPHSRL